MLTIASSAALMLGFLSLSQIGLILVGILGFIVAFGLAVFVHELGHFLAAKAFGVPVERFVIGFDKQAIGFMPRCILEWQWGETTYGIALVPLGGYVMMKGTVHPDIEQYLEEPRRADTVPTDATRLDGPPRPVDGSANSATLSGQAMDDMAALYRKPFWQKLIIYGAGVAMNMLLAIMVLTLLYTKGTNESAPFAAEVAWLAPTSQWAGTEVREGDRVIAVNNESVNDSEELLRVMLPGWASRDEASTWTLRLSRGDSTTYEVEVALPPFAVGERVREDFLRTFIHMPPFVEHVIINDAADKAGIRGGDLVVAVDGMPMQSWYQFRELVRASAGKELIFEVLRGTQTKTFRVTPTRSPDPQDNGAGLIGVVPGNTNRELVQEPFLVALGNSPGRAYNFTVNYVRNLKRLGGNLVEGNVNMVRRELGGPVAIAQVAYRQAQKGVTDWLKFLIMLNIALAVMNILPLPVLDGGHICFALYEAIFRKPVPPRVLIPLLNGAFIFLMVFFVLVTFNDVLRIFL